MGRSTILLRVLLDLIVIDGAPDCPFVRVVLKVMLAGAIFVVVATFATGRMRSFSYPLRIARRVGVALSSHEARPSGTKSRPSAASPGRDFSLFGSAKLCRGLTGLSSSPVGPVTQVTDPKKKRPQRGGELGPPFIRCQRRKASGRLNQFILGTNVPQCRRFTIPLPTSPFQPRQSGQTGMQTKWRQPPPRYRRSK